MHKDSMVMSQKGLHQQKKIMAHCCCDFGPASQTVGKHLVFSGQLKLYTTLCMFLAVVVPPVASISVISVVLSGYRCVSLLIHSGLLL